MQRQMMNFSCCKFWIYQEPVLKTKFSCHVKFVFTATQYINSKFTTWQIMIWNVKLLYIRIMINLHKVSSTEIRPNNNIYKMHLHNKWHKKRHHKDRNAHHTIKLLMFLKTINFFTSKFTKIRNFFRNNYW